MTFVNLHDKIKVDKGKGLIDMKNLVNYILENNGATYNPRQKELVFNGYACSGIKENETIINGKVTENDIVEYINKFELDFTNNDRAMLGVWYNTENDKTYLDTSFVHNDLQSALDSAKELQELAIFDLNKLEEIRL